MIHLCQANYLDNSVTKDKIFFDLKKNVVQKGETKHWLLKLEVAAAS